MNTDKEKELFAEPGLIQVTAWTRGVVGNKEARDVVQALAEAGRLEGKYTQAWENYVDLPDRVYVPIRAFARISPQPLLRRYIFENNEPNIVILVEETLVKGIPVLEGLQEGGVLVVNTRRSPMEIAQYLPRNSKLEKLVTVDATAYAKAIQTLDGGEGSADITGLASSLAAPLVGAVARATDVVHLDSLKQVVANKEALVKGYENARIENFSLLIKESA